jgi:hypothetical protein
MGRGIEGLRVHVGQHDGSTRSEAMCDGGAHSAGPDDDYDVFAQLM